MSYEVKYRGINLMSGHHPFQRIVENLPEDRKLEIERKKKELLAAIELRKATIPIANDKPPV